MTTLPPSLPSPSSLLAPCSRLLVIPASFRARWNGIYACRR